MVLNGPFERSYRMSLLRYLKNVKPKFTVKKKFTVILAALQNSKSKGRIATILRFDVASILKPKNKNNCKFYDSHFVRYC